VTQNFATDSASGISVRGPNGLVSQNVATDNLDEGIAVLCRATVTNNTATGNSDDYALSGTGCFDKGNH